MASAYTAFDSTKPAGTQTGPQFATSANANDVALWYAVVAGNAAGFAFSTVVGTGTAEQPQYFVHTNVSNTAIRIRATNTWGSSAGELGNLKQQVWQISTDTGTTPNATGTWADICTQTYTYDASGNLTATTAASGTSSWLGYLVGKVKGLVTSLATHAALTGTSAHGLGTLSTQAASAVAITGGAVDGATIGGTTPAAMHYTSARGKKTALGSITGAQAIDWLAADLYTLTVGSAGGNVTWSNLPSGEAGAVTLEVTNPGVATNLFPTGANTYYPNGSAPSRTVSGVDIYECFCHDGTHVTVVQVIKDRK